MSKSLAASKQLMQTYLSELLTEEEVEQKTALVKERKHLFLLESVKLAIAESRPLCQDLHPKQRHRISLDSKADKQRNTPANSSAQIASPNTDLSYLDYFEANL